MKNIVAIILIIVLVLLVYCWFYFAKTYPLTSPVKSAQYYIAHLRNPHAKMRKVAIGFMPYWRVDDIIKYTRLDVITEVNYFGLYVNGDGEFVKVVNGETNPGRREWESQKVKDFITEAHIMGSSFTLSIVCQNDKDIRSILDSQNARDKLIANILYEVKSRDLDGVNVDFEYLSPVDIKYQQKFTDFSNKLKQALKKQNTSAKLEISIQPQSTRKQDIIDFDALVPIYDNFIGMSYDFYGGSSTIAGPIAPMTGFKENKYFFDVTTMYEDLEKHIPKEKVVMGVPYYGWDWAVENGGKIQSTTLLQTDANNYAAVISYERAKEDKNLKKSQCQFDDYAKEPWCWYTDKKTGIDHQVWFEDTKSIGIKYEFAKNNDFSGIAIWVLGYDKKYPDLWNIMKEKFASNNSSSN